MERDTNFIERIKSTFPLIKSKRTYNLVSIDEYDEKKKNLLHFCY